jgi:hypothetical protein
MPRPVSEGFLCQYAFQRISVLVHFLYTLTDLAAEKVSSPRERPLALNLRPTPKLENNHAQQFPNRSIESCGLASSDRRSGNYRRDFSACARQPCNGTGIE